jgi:hypothetical protein
MLDYDGYKCVHCTTMTGFSGALYAKAVGPVLLPGNRWGQLMCVWGWSALTCRVFRFTLQVYNSIQIVCFSQLMRLLDPLYCIE